MKSIKKTSLSKPRQQLIERMQAIDFGRITNIAVANGEPILSSETIIERQIKLGSQSIQRDQPPDNFLLKKEVLTLFNEMTRMGNGTIREIDIKHGLPFALLTAERAA